MTGDRNSTNFTARSRNVMSGILSRRPASAGFNRSQKRSWIYAAATFGGAVRRCLKARTRNESMRDEQVDDCGHNEEWARAARNRSAHGSLINCE